jgi:Gluconate 2-dehydrogenase subunit 3
VSPARPAPPPPLDVPAGGGARDTPYPDFDVAAADKWALDWDEKTRRLVLDRLRHVPPYHYFSPAEARLLEAVCARLLPQDDRPPAERIPIAPWVDDRLARGEGDGYRYADMPGDGEAYRRGLRGIAQTAELLFHRPFVELDAERQDAVLRRVADGAPPGEAWSGLPARRLFQELVGEAIARYYAHPAAWAEIGFSGPASPRGHIRLAPGKRDPWEAHETRPRSSVEIVRRALAAGGGGTHAAGGPTH